MKYFTLLLLVLFTSISWSQDYRFGKVSKEELAETFYPLDSTANAAILYSERKTSFDFSEEKGFFIIEEYFVRLKIYNQNAYEKAAEKILAYHSSNGKEAVFGIKATTYNLENGKIEETDLSKKNIFEEEENKYYDSYKFTMPNLKPGCIVEWKYTFETPFFGNLNKVKIQEDIPVQKLSITIATPEYFNYNTSIRGFLKIPIEERKVNRKVSHTDIVRSPNRGFQSTKSRVVRNEFSYDELIQSIEMTNIPAIKEEAFSGNINNYKSSIYYELSFIKYPNSSLETYATNWESVVEKIYNSSSFGEQLKKSNFFEDDLQILLKDKSSTDDRIAAIFQFVKDKIKWNGYYGFYSDEGVKKAYKNGVGNVADINLNLVAMLQAAGLEANPVLVSTVDNGIPLFPTRNGFNYVIARVVTPNGPVLLDATDINALPDVLPKRVLNFRGRVVRNNGDSDWIELFPTKHSIIQSSVTANFNEDNISGITRTAITNNYLLAYRETARGKSEEALLDWLDDDKKDIEIVNARVSNLDKLDKDVFETIQFETESFYEEIADKTYISPMLYLQLDENPFKSEIREYPVFYNTPWAEVATIKLQIPDTYKVQNLPESVMYTLLDNLGVFKYDISAEGQIITIESNFIINQPVISATDYQELRDFYKNVINKQKEKIVISSM